ncbi:MULTISPECIES: transposase [unclassified Rhizobium]|uniref:transposase n=1 Tax=unclassified Rhizobium TaxID=2613769 RepID=UPI0017A8931B|nr:MULTISPECIES: transposase [unclassified Rhizobium]MBB3387239.1 hypothetical protein [Rhizobium sp. BK098]MBB3618941.1 hypothetical protein [Rhizobium sp. BK609]MBB3684599.1 hypothetical protein [Rhizobium sp. BK612]
MTEASHAHFRRHRFPAEIIAHAVWLYYRFPLSLHDVEDLLAERGIAVSFQTVAEWAAKFGLKFAHQLRRRSRGQFADKWQLDEMVVTIKGKKYWLWPIRSHASRRRFVAMPAPCERELLILLQREYDESKIPGRIHMNGACHHKSSGVIVDLGPGVSEFAEDEIVEVSWLQNVCLRCECFEMGLGRKCEHQRIKSRSAERPGTDFVIASVVSTNKLTDN